jgi:hypothetical protein
MRRRVLLVFLLCLGLALAAVAPVAAGPLTPGPLVQVSGTSAFAGCAADAVASQSGTVYLNSEVEPWVDVNPTNPSNVVGIWQQDRWSNGGARGLVAGVSSNGGSSWQQVPIPGITLCSGGAYQRSTDPWISFGPNGTLYQLALSFNDIAPPFLPADFDHALLASRSVDGGLTWSAPVVVRRDTDANVFNDKQTITADPTAANLVYGVWDRLVFPSSEAASVRASFRTSAFRGPIWFARSTNGGVSWEPARQLYDPGQNDQTIGNQIVVLPNGTLVNAFAEFNNENTDKLRGWTVRVLRSTDKGLSWSGPILVDRLQTIGVTDPDTGDDTRTGDIIPDVAVDPASGRLYAVWQDARFSDGAFDSIAFSQSLDGGLSWSTPIKVNQTPTNLPVGNQQAFTASVHVSADGTVGVSYYDFRNNTSAPATLETDYFLVHCHPTTPTACATAGNWGDEVRVTNTSFNMRQAPNAAGFFTGDYEGLDNIGTAFTRSSPSRMGPTPPAPSSAESDKTNQPQPTGAGMPRTPPQSASRSQRVTLDPRRFDAVVSGRSALWNGRARAAVSSLTAPFLRLLRSHMRSPTTAGLRRSVVMSGSSVAAPKGDAQGVQRSAWVTGVAAQRGGDVDWSRPAQRPDDQVA